MLNKTYLVDVSRYVTNGEWMLIKYTIERNEVVYPISSAIYPDVTVILIIQRRILYYVLNILFPCFWLNILSVLTFCLPPDAGEKITLSITVLLSYSVFMLLVAESMPPTSEFVPLIGKSNWNINLFQNLSFSELQLNFTYCIHDTRCIRNVYNKRKLRS